MKFVLPTSTTLILCTIFTASSYAYFLTSNKIDPARDRFVTVTEYYNQIRCTKNCTYHCYNFQAYRWDELSHECYECIGNCSKKNELTTIQYVQPAVLREVSVCCPSYDKYHGTVLVNFDVWNADVLKEAYVVWEYRMSRGVDDFAPSPWMTILQTRARRATIEGLLKQVSFQFRANLVDGVGPIERATTKWIDIEDPYLEGVRIQPKDVPTTTTSSTTTTTSPTTTTTSTTTSTTRASTTIRSTTRIPPTQKHHEKKPKIIIGKLGKKTDPEMGHFSRARRK